METQITPRVTPRVTSRVTPALLCRAYAVGVFPMAQSRDSRELMWVEPQMRGILPLDKFRLSRRDERALRKAQFSVTINNDFSAVVRACAERKREQHNSQDSSQNNTQDTSCDTSQDTWINEEIERVYCELHRQGYAHSIEVYSNAQSLHNPRVLVGGLYGVALGAAFFGESMFSNQSNASKAALRYLVERLRACKYELLDVQFKTAHLERFGVLEVSQQKYRQYLKLALQKKCRLS